VEQLRSRLDSAKYFPFILKKQVLHRHKGKVELQTKLLFPGYIIIETKCCYTEVLLDFDRILKESPSKIYSLLYYGNDVENIMMSKSEQITWESLLDSDFCISASEGYYENGELKIISGPLIGKESWVKKLNRYKSKAIIGVEFSGELIEMSVVLSIRGSL
jgi:transcriptional antiterminator NusG